MRFMDFRGLRLGPWQLLKLTVKEFLDDEMPTYAAALAYQGLFSLFPFLLFLIALLGFLHLPEFFDWLREQAAYVLPGQALEQVNPIIDQLQQRQGGLLSVGIVVALWSSSAAVRSLMNALNAAYDVREARPVWKRVPLSLLYTLGLAVMLMLVTALMILGPQVMGWIAERIGLQDYVVVLWSLLRWPVMVLLMMMAVAVIYYATPNVKQKFRFITPGSVLAVVAWVAASLAFGFYVKNFADYNAMYGSVGAIIVLLLYFYISAAVLLLGAELNAVIEHHLPHGKNPGERTFEQAETRSPEEG
ncbi:YihY/virulence factor BrkB family protein [Pseudomonas sp. R3.Fl]|jgi:membrane protein|uniref:Ribonuclease BN n=1 Tax=Pseudomonas citronellolis TaxID=53408 RepID=A0A127MWR1_9PSED|nr:MULTISPECIES: YihY/virulence factor BrkB family protein [Pseudomonas]KSW22972.1 ribonuclease BN [Pseudomonas sp. ADP]AMO77719.1 ribonuclease BN/unknown domain fusion protein [Pseudomonas citronellolis]ANI16399.1 ribonuclease BN [Pseudomonas citronellolis]KWR80605.1 ribonuclease BN [Pseudomonas sp. PI1]MBB1608366.1 ribonuclease BN [Pseudomonas sp. UMC76]